ncbi:hypothetical protein EB796_012168 [Bugula neritina]|uniref:Uncharacterized protein n=1 Tax=Bugula neritina TaxID=10212 RepID=A0A7J7JUV9_BUGNE|nr:hypothetical protein EB796_012168 [Bugula neritina]
MHLIHALFISSDTTGVYQQALPSADDTHVYTHLELQSHELSASLDASRNKQEYEEISMKAEGYVNHAAVFPALTSSSGDYELVTGQLYEQPTGESNSTYANSSANNLYCNV